MIYYVEDEKNIRELVEYALLANGFEIKCFAEGAALWQELRKDVRPELILLDIMLPELNGLEVIRRLRKSSSVPVILLTARDAVMDKVAGLDMGANDYITKPFAIEELLARIRAQLRQGENAHESSNGGVLTAGRLSLDPQRHEVRYAGTLVELTQKEFAMLELLLRNKDIVLSRETFLERVWGYDYMGETNIVDVYIRFLRAKLDARFGVTLIRTVRGVGYVLREAE